MRLWTILALTFAIAWPASAQVTCQQDFFGNVRCSDGGGFRQSYSDNWQGTGTYSGGGYRQDGFGNLQGTGNLSGSGWKQNGLGTWYGTGDNAGRSCRTVLGRTYCN